jgi:hypothetical protein
MWHRSHKHSHFAKHFTKWLRLHQRSHYTKVATATAVLPQPKPCQRGLIIPKFWNQKQPASTKMRIKILSEHHKLGFQPTHESQNPSIVSENREPKGDRKKQMRDRGHVTPDRRRRRWSEASPTVWGARSPRRGRRGRCTRAAACWRARWGSPWPPRQGIPRRPMS